jgi:hypothetical protein
MHNKIFLIFGGAATNEPLPQNLQTLRAKFRRGGIINISY